MFDRYNRLLDTIHKSLQDLLKALKGLVVMSQELENMANSLYNNMVPSMWASKVGGSAAYKMSQVDHSPPPIAFQSLVSVGRGSGLWLATQVDLCCWCDILFIKE